MVDAPSLPTDSGQPDPSFLGGDPLGGGGVTPPGDVSFLPGDQHGGVNPADLFATVLTKDQLQNLVTAGLFPLTGEVTIPGRVPGVSGSGIHGPGHITYNSLKSTFGEDSVVFQMAAG